MSSWHTFYDINVRTLRKFSSCCIDCYWFGNLKIIFFILNIFAAFSNIWLLKKEKQCKYCGITIHKNTVYFHLKKITAWTRSCVFFFFNLYLFHVWPLTRRADHHQYNDIWFHHILRDAHNSSCNSLNI